MYTNNTHMHCACKHITYTYTSSLGAGGLEKNTASLVHQSDTKLARETTEKKRTQVTFATKLLIHL